MIINVPVGDYASGEGADVLRTDGIGSCLVTVLYEKSTRTGIMIHSLLPTYLSNSRPSSFIKYVDSGIYIALSEIYHKTDGRDIVAKIVGGGRLSGIGDRDIGYDNVRKAREILNKEKIPLISEDTGGDFGRMSEFDILSGNLKIKTLLRGEYII